MTITRDPGKITGMLSYDNDLPLPVLVPMKTSFPSAKAWLVMKLTLLYNDMLSKTHYEKNFQLEKGV
jgi:hypothetical protein